MNDTEAEQVHIGARRARTWPRWALWALMSGQQRAAENIWGAHQHLFDDPRKTPLQKAHHYRQLARSWYKAWIKNERSLTREASGPGPLSPLFQEQAWQH